MSYNKRMLMVLLSSYDILINLLSNDTVDRVKNSGKTNYFCV